MLDLFRPDRLENQRSSIESFVIGEGPVRGYGQIVETAFVASLRLVLDSTYLALLIILEEQHCVADFGRGEGEEVARRASRSLLYGSLGLLLLVVGYESVHTVLHVPSDRF